MKKETKRKIRSPGRVSARAGPSGKKKTGRNKGTGSAGKTGDKGKWNTALSGSLKKAGSAVKEKLRTVNVRNEVIN